MPGLASVLIGSRVLLVAGAPGHLVVMVVGMFLVLLVVTAVNQIWKLSVHAAILAASGEKMSARSCRFGAGLYDGGVEGKSRGRRPTPTKE